MKIVSLVLSLACLCLPGCQSLEQTIAMPADKTASFESNLTNLTEQLIQTSRFNFQRQSIVTTTFVSTNTLDNKNMTPHLQTLGLMLEEGIMSRLVQAGANVTEIKSSSAIFVSSSASTFLTRDIEQLAQQSNAHGVLVGTMTELNDGIMVNARIIDIVSKQVIAAGRQYFSATPLDVTQQITIRNGHIYRYSNQRKL